MINEDFSANLLNNYAFFISQNHLEEVITIYQTKIQEANFTKEYFKSYSHSNFLTHSQREIEWFIQTILENRIINEINPQVPYLNTNKILGLSIDTIKSSDIVTMLYLRNESLYQYIPNFSNDLKIALELIREIQRVSNLQEIFFLNEIDKLQQDKSIDKKNTERSKHEKIEPIESNESIIQVGYWEIDILSKEMHLSDEIMSLLRITQNEPFRLDDLKEKIYEGNDYLNFLNNLTQLKDTSKNFYLHEFKVRVQNGEIKNLISQDYPILDQQRNIIGLKSIIQDISNATLTVENLKEGLWQMQKILQYSPTYINIYEIDSDKLVYSNNAGRRHFGISRIGLYQNDYSKILDKIAHPDDREKLNKRFKNFQNLKDNEFDEIEFRFIDSHGNTIWFYSRAIVFKRVEGKVTQVLLNAINITERKKAEEELKYLSDRLNEAQKIGHVGSYEWDLVNDIINYSEEAYRIYNLPLDKKEFKISEFKSLMNKNDLIKFEENLSNVLASDSIYENEFKLHLPNDKEIDIITRAKTIRNKEGNPIKIIGTVSDITRSKEAEQILKDKNREIQEAYRKLEESEKEVKKINSELEERIRIRTSELKKSEDRYRSFINHSSEGIFRYELRGIPYIDTTLPLEKQMELIFEHAYFAESNDMFSQLYGIDSAQDLIGKSIKFLFQPNDPVINNLTRNFIKSNYRILDYDYKITKSDGQEIYLRLNIFGIVEDNKLYRTWSTYKNITERVKAIEELKISEERYKVLAETVPQIYWTARADGGVDFYNQKWYEYTGSTFEETSEWGWQPFIHQDDFQQLYITWTNSIQSGLEFNIEFRLKRADGIYKWHLVKGLPLKDEVGKIIKWMGTVTDIDEQKRYTEQLKQKNEQLIRINNDLDNFIYTASHDLKAPISNIEGLLTTLNMEMSDQCKKEGDVLSILSLMESSVNKFKKTIFNLTEITHAQKSGEEVIQDNYLPEALEEVKSMVDDLIKISQIEIKTDFKECSSIKFSSRNFKSILYNLLSNAIKYRSLERKPWVLIKTECLEDYILLSIEDNGLGFDNSQLPKVFGMFKRLHSHIEGSGVGLYIVKRIITNAGGKIEASGEKGKGSIFKVFFKRD